jgi:hypothetical protein
MFLLACQDDEPIITCNEIIDDIQMNEYQVIGSHNSYRKSIAPEILFFMVNSPELLPEDFDPGSWDYAHETLEDQLSMYDVRSIELDVYRDPTGGLFYARIGNAFVGLDPDSKETALLEPGLKVLHFPDFDYNTHFLTFKESLESVKAWSNAHPNHLPITVLVEAKEDSPDAMLPGFGLTASIPFDNGSVEEIENEINEVFTSDFNKILVPDDVRKSYSTLQEAVTNKAWPTINETRGKIVFVLMASDEIIDDYKQGRTSLEGRNMFVFRESNQVEDPAAAFIKIDDPVANYNKIQELVSLGYMVRTRADADTYEARSGDSNRKMTAFQSGAQIVSTDYYRPDPRAMNGEDWSLYSAYFPNNELAILNSEATNAENITCEVTE